MKGLTEGAAVPEVCHVDGCGGGGTPSVPSRASRACCVGEDGHGGDIVTVSRRGRRARALAGFGFLALAGAMATRQAPGRVALWPAATVPAWFGISHLVAGVTGYQGCPELGAIPSVLLDRPVATGCGPWERIDNRLDSWLPGRYP
jgi:hypothetical protein